MLPEDEKPSAEIQKGYNLSMHDPYNYTRRKRAQVKDFNGHTHVTGQGHVSSQAMRGFRTAAINYQPYQHRFDLVALVSAPDPTDAAADGLHHRYAHLLTRSGDVIHPQLHPLGLGPRLWSPQSGLRLLEKKCLTGGGGTGGGG